MQILFNYTIAGIYNQPSRKDVLPCMVDWN